MIVRPPSLSRIHINILITKIRISLWSDRVWHTVTSLGKGFGSPWGSLTLQECWLLWPTGLHIRTQIIWEMFPLIKMNLFCQSHVLHLFYSTVKTTSCKVPPDGCKGFIHTWTHTSTPEYTIRKIIGFHWHKENNFSCHGAGEEEASEMERLRKGVGGSPSLESVFILCPLLLYRPISSPQMPFATGSGHIYTDMLTQPGAHYLSSAYAWQHRH